MRAGLEQVDYESYPKVAHVDLDFVSGYLFREPSLRHELWGGLGLVMVDSARAAYFSDRVVQERYYAAFDLLRRARDQLIGRRPPVGGGVAELEQRLDQTRGWLDDVQGSASWRVTEPLRARQARAAARRRVSRPVADRVRLAASPPARGRGHRRADGRGRRGARRLAEVTVITSSTHEERYRELSRTGDRRSAARRAGGVRRGAGRWASTAATTASCTSTARACYERLRELYGADGPDLIEFADFLGEGLVTVQARRARDPLPARAPTVCVRLHTSAEICSVLNGCVDDELRHARDGRRSSGTRCATPTAPRSRRRRARHLPPLLRRGRLAPAVSIRPRAAGAPGRRRPRLPLGEPLRLLYLGRLERRKGVAGPDPRGHRAAPRRLDG